MGDLTSLAEPEDVLLVVDCVEVVMVGGGTGLDGLTGW